MKRFGKIGLIVLVAAVALVGLYIAPILAAPDPSFNYTITATGTEDVTTYPGQTFSWGVTVSRTERYEYEYWCGTYCCEEDWLGYCIRWCDRYCTEWRYETRSYTRTGSGVVNATEGWKLITNLDLPPLPPYHGGYITNVTRTVTDNNARVTTSLSGTGGNRYDLKAITNYSETGPQPWSGTEEGSASVSVADGDKYITTSTLVAPNGDTAWSVSDDSDCVKTWMDGAELYAAVDDTQPPSITCPADVILECPADTSPEATGYATGEDACGDVEITYTDEVTAGCGDTETIVRTWTAEDESGNTASCVQTITVVDTTPPTIGVSVSPETLWPPNHKLVDITAMVTVNDNCDSAPSVVLTSVVSNEPDNAQGDGNTEPDWVIDEDGNLRLRAERAGGGDGRVYTITYTVTDVCGNSASANVTVIVPHDQRDKNK